MKNILILSCASLFIAAFAMAQTQEPTKPSALVKKKLDHAQKILIGLTTEDYPLMSQNAEKLLALTEKQWTERATADYKAQLKDFSLAVNSVREHAAQKDLDQASEAYFQMTQSCLSCHKYLRNEKS